MISIFPVLKISAKANVSQFHYKCVISGKSNGDHSSVAQSDSSPPAYCHLVAPRRLSAPADLFCTQHTCPSLQTNWIHNVWLTLHAAHIISAAVDRPLAVNLFYNISPVLRRCDIANKMENW